VVDLMSLSPRESHPHGMEPERFTALFTDTQPVIFAFHGYVRIIHDLVHGRPDPVRFHVRGFMEEGTTTTPFDMVVLNNMSRYHLAMEAIKRVKGLAADPIIELFKNKLAEHDRYIKEHLEDMPEISDWKWS